MENAVVTVNDQNFTLKDICFQAIPGQVIILIFKINEMKGLCDYITYGLLENE